MKNTLFIVVLLLLFSCQKKLDTPIIVSTVNQDNIAKFYNDQIHKDEIITDSILNYTLKLEKACEKESNEHQAMIAIVMGLQSSNKASYLLGLKHYEKALSLLRFSTADSLKAKAYNAIGNNYKSTGDYSKAFKNLYKSLALYEKTNNAIGICSVNKLLGDVYFQMGQLEKAKMHLLAGLKVLENQKSNIVYLTTAHSLANFYGKSYDIENALKIDEMGIRVSDSINAPTIKVSFLNNKAMCYLVANKMDSAYIYFNECLKLDLIIGNNKQIADSYSSLGQYFMANGNYLEAEKQVKKSIILLKSIDAKPNLAISYTILTDIYANQNQYKKAFATQKERMLNNKLMLEEKEAAALSEYKIDVFPVALLL